jgi:ribosomal protein L37AE/L43A
MKRCPNCQTTALRADADSCWYCGFKLLADANGTKPSLARRPKARGMSRRLVQREDAQRVIH